MGETTTGTITSLDDVRPGDLCFTRIGGLVPGVFPVAAGMLALGERVRIGRVRFDHVIVVTESGAERGSPWPLGVQAMPSGAEEICLTPARHWNAWTVYARPPEDWPGQAADAAAIARLMAEARVPYSFGSYAMLAAWRYGLEAEWLARRIDRRGAVVKLPRWSNGPDQLPPGRTRGGRLPREAICSVLADQAWTLAGKQVMPHGTRPQIVTPGGLGMRLWRDPRVVWGGESLLG